MLEAILKCLITNMFLREKKKIDLYLDGPTFQEIGNFKNVDGYTFNPSLCKKLEAEDYIEFTKKFYIR